MTKRIDLSFTSKEFDALAVGLVTMERMGFKPVAEAVLQVTLSRQRMASPGQKPQCAMELTVEGVGCCFAAASCLYTAQQMGQISDSPHTLEELDVMTKRLSGYLSKFAEEGTN